jgi:2,3-bisphosphoglycerate-dependent phosphoglycerate mutase
MSEHTLVITRHGQSDGNRRNVFTGWMNLPLTEQGEAEARASGKKLANLGLKFDEAFTSGLMRAQKTCELMLEELGQAGLKTTANIALNERDYGDLAGLNKDESRAKWGEEQVHIWRRSYDVPPPGGESLKDTVARVLPYYVNVVLPAVLENKATLITAHGNSLRALMMAIEGIPAEKIPTVELTTGEMRRYTLSGSGLLIKAEVLTA